MQKVFVPGGAGYIGSKLCPTLLKMGYQVTVVDNLMYQQNSLLDVIGHPNFRFEFGDFLDTEKMVKMAQAHDWTLPLAALVGAPACDQKPELARELNLNAPLRFFSAVPDQVRILMPTTNSAYGSGDSNHHCDETSPLKPISTYAEMKVEVERALLKRKNSISFRLATVFGISPRMRLDLLVNDFTFRAIRDQKIQLFEGHFKRNYIHVGDVCRVFVHGFENFEKLKGQIFNVGLSDANLSKIELCQVLKKHLPKFEFSEDSGGRDPDQRNYIVSNRKIEGTGFSTKFTLDDGIQEILMAYPLLDYSRMRNH